MNLYNYNFDLTGIFPIIMFTSCLKILFLNSYHSTDFEVHRNWLAITSTLPLSEWYFEKTSEWTLDYPPFFAWFESFLSYFAEYFDKEMLVLDNLNYTSRNTVLFQRMTVIFADLILVFAVNKFYNQCLPNSLKDKTTKSFLMIATILNPGLLMVDHIHFQYNGFLFGILLLSIGEMLQNKALPSAFWFTILLNFKHIFLYIAPVYFVFLLRNYCFTRDKKLQGFWIMLGVDVKQLSIVNLFKLAVIVVSIFALSFGPFVYMGQLQQLVSRLFPVQRGLCHAYWAANFWAVYASLDKALLTAGPKLGLSIRKSDIASMTGGLVAQQSFSVLPNVPPLATAVITLLFMMPVLLKLWYRPHDMKLFLPALSLCAYASFLFGYHVHEKAVLMVIVPLIFLALNSAKYARVYIILSITGHYALFPLLYKDAETPLKITILLLSTLVTLSLLKSIHKNKCAFLGLPFVTWYEALYIYGLIPLYIYTDLVHWMLGLQAKLPFVPLMMTSLYCSVGIVWSWLVLYEEFLFGRLFIKVESKRKK